MSKLTIYGSGDVATQQLRSLATAKGVTWEMRDIRCKDAVGARADLIFLIREGLTTVPQVWRDGVYLGGFGAVWKYLVELPEPKRMPSYA